jgi:hypothetical protein
MHSVCPQALKLEINNKNISKKTHKQLEAEQHIAQ